MPEPEREALIAAGAAPPARPGARRRQFLVFLALAVLVTAADLVTKDLVFRYVAEHGDGTDRVTVIDGWFWLARHENSGGMWGVGQDWNPWILRIVRLGAVAVILMILLQSDPRDRLSTVALGLVLGGAAGNIHDSLRFDAVRDFLQFDLGFPPFSPFPTFNVADSAICVGVGLLALQLLLGPRPAAASTRGTPPG